MQLTFGDIVLDIPNRQLTGPRGWARLSKVELAIVAAMLQAPMDVIPYAEMYVAVWDQKPPRQAQNVLSVMCSRIRRKLVENGSRTRLENVRGLGLILRKASANVRFLTDDQAMIVDRYLATGHFEAATPKAT